MVWKEQQWMANYLKQSESNIHEKGEFMNNGLVESWICSYLRLQGCKWASLYLFLPNNQISGWWFCGYICPVMVVWVPRGPSWASQPNANCTSSTNMPFLEPGAHLHSLRYNQQKGRRWVSETFQSLKSSTWNLVCTLTNLGYYSIQRQGRVTT